VNAAIAADEQQNQPGAQNQEEALSGSADEPNAKRAKKEAQRKKAEKAAEKKVRIKGCLL
jgi:hypothetical protein